MEVGFDMIRLGSFRKSAVDEQLIKESVTNFKRSIRDILSDIEGSKEELVMIIPARGFDVKIDISCVNNLRVKELLKEQFPTSIRVLSDSELHQNLFNRIYSF